MLLSRVLPLVRRALLKPCPKSAVHRVNNTVRNHSDGIRYRNQGDLDAPKIELATDICYTFFWWWVCYHFITKYEHLIGEYPYPDASSWTDEELGVPPDDYEPPNRV